MTEDEKKTNRGFIQRYVPKDWAIPAVAGLTIVATLHGTVEGQTIDVPAQAIGAGLSGSISSTAAYSTFIAVADTNFDKVYEVGYATLRSDVEQGAGTASSPGTMSVVRYVLPSRFNSV